MAQTKSCLKYNGVCRYNFPQFPCKETIFAEPLPLKYSTEEEKKIRDKEIADKNEKAKEILEDAKKLLNRNDLEELIEKKVLEIRILTKWSQYTTDDSNLEDHENSEANIIKQNLKGKCNKESDQEKLRLIDLIYDEMKNKKVEVKMNEDSEMEAFCQLITAGLTYKDYVESLHTTKKGRYCSCDKELVKDG